MKDVTQKAKITIEVPADLKVALVARAKSEDSDISKVCRNILRRHIAEATPPPDAPGVEHPKAA